MFLQDFALAPCFYGASQVTQWWKSLPANAGNAGEARDTSSILGLGRSPGEGDGNPLQYPCLENPMDREPSGLQSIGLQRVRHNWVQTPTTPCSLDGKEFACSAEDLGSIPGSGRSPGEGNSNPLQYSCLENPMDRGVWWATVHGAQTVRHNWATKLLLQNYIFAY